LDNSSLNWSYSGVFLVLIGKMDNEFSSSNRDLPQLCAERANLVIDALLSQLITTANVAKMRLEIMSQSENQDALQHFLCDAVNSVGVKLTDEALRVFLNEACSAFLDNKISMCVVENGVD